MRQISIKSCSTHNSSTYLAGSFLFLFPPSPSKTSSRITLKSPPTMVGESHSAVKVLISSEIFEKIEFARYTYLEHKYLKDNNANPE